MTILQTRLPYDPNDPRPLPGIRPLDPEDWLLRDEAFAAQMAERDRLLAMRRAEVLARAEGARPAAEELLEEVLARYYPEAGETALRPDGVRVPVDRADPMGTLGRLVQEDLCILEQHGDEHVMTAAVLCFPASWRLEEKFLRPLTAIHGPVEEYDDEVARRVQRLFFGIRPGRPLWRFNALWYEEAALFQPRSESAPRAFRDRSRAPYLRSERQALWRLERSGAVVFSIHTYVLARETALARGRATGGPVRS